VADELVTVPADLTLLSDSDLSDLELRAVAEFDRLNADDNVTPDILEYQLRLTNDLDRIRAELAGRATRAAEAAARERARLVSERNDLHSRVHGGSRDGGTENGGGSGGGGGAAPISVEAIAEASARGATAALMAAIGNRRLDQTTVTQRATASLAAARQHQVQVPVPKQRLAITAGVDIPGVARGSDLVSLDDLVNAIQRTAKTMPITRDGNGQERLVASIRNEFEHTVDDRTSPAQVEELLNYLRRPEKMEALLAGGGWCAPSEIRYEFFNVADVSGLVDLPTVGITRGGLRFPVSPTIADAFKNDAGATIGLAPFGAVFSNASDPWLWTETDDIASVTGTAPIKPTLRVACPSFSEARLECYGITMTAGNLTDDAYPEATAHTLRLLLTAWQHAQNARIISQMVALSSAAITGIGSVGTAPSHPVFQMVMNGLSLATTDYKAKYAMNDDTIVEVIAPFWLRECIQADLAWRAPGDNTLSVTNAMINSWAADRQFSVQWVNDWQVRGAGQFGNATTPMVAWPTTADVLVYAAGTFIKGNGLSLDLGVVRDSTLNKTNDFTAAWSEECHLVARVGNESRRYTLPFNVDGATTAPITAAVQI
jgi:hypothetical protein